jgi:hypothetical protein
MNRNLACDFCGLPLPLVVGGVAPGHQAFRMQRSRARKLKRTLLAARHAAGSYGSITADLERMDCTAKSEYLACSMCMEIAVTYRKERPWWKFWR